MSDVSFTHILQQKGILKNFSIIKVMPSSVIERLKEDIRSKAETDEEFSKLFDEAMQKIANMHDQTNPIPGIIYHNRERAIKNIIESAISHCKKIGTRNYTKNESCLYVMSLINAIGLTEEDFANLRLEMPDDENFTQKH